MQNGKRKCFVFVLSLFVTAVVDEYRIVLHWSVRESMSESRTVTFDTVYSFGTGTHGAEVGLQVDEWLPDSRTPSTDSPFTCCADYSS